MCLYPRFGDRFPADEHNYGFLPLLLHSADNLLHQLALRPDKTQIAQIHMLSSSGVGAGSPQQRLIERPSTDKNYGNVGRGRG